MAVGGEGFAESGIWSATRRIDVAPPAWQPRLRRISRQRLRLTRRERDRRPRDQYRGRHTGGQGKGGGSEQVESPWNFRALHEEFSLAVHVTKSKNNLNSIDIAPQRKCKFELALSPK
jgi:hypothetical protein